MESTAKLHGAVKIRLTPVQADYLLALVDDGLLSDLEVNEAAIVQNVPEHDFDDLRDQILTTCEPRRALSDLAATLDAIVHQLLETTVIADARISVSGRTAVAQSDQLATAVGRANTFDPTLEEMRKDDGGRFVSIPIESHSGFLMCRTFDPPTPRLTKFLTFVATQISMVLTVDQLVANRTEIEAVVYAEGRHQDQRNVSFHSGFSVDQARNLLHSQDDTERKRIIDLYDDATLSVATNLASQTTDEAIWTTTFDNRYSLVELAGRGGFGVVYRTFDNVLSREVALKTQSSGPGSSRPSPILREALILGGLEHPNISPVFDVGLPEYSKSCFFTMKYLEGKTWRDWISDRPEDKRALKAFWRTLLPGFANICDALHHAHTRGVVHSDPKPTNVMVDSNLRATIFDWGLSRVFDMDKWPRVDDEKIRETLEAKYFDGHAVGTPNYMSPEHIKGQVEPRSDVFTLGATLYELLTGVSRLTKKRQHRSVEHIFDQIMAAEFPSPRELDTSIPKRLEQICVTALAHRPEDRFQTALELGNAVKSWLGQ